MMMYTAEGLLAFHAAVHQSLDLMLDHAAALAPPVLDTPVAGFGAGTIRAQIVHVVGNEAAWVRGLRMLPAEPLSLDDFRTVGSLRLGKRQVAAATREYFSSLDQSALNAPLPELPRGWVGPPRSPAFILLHVLTHACHHKGQMAAMFRLLGHPAPDTDLQRAEP